MKEDRLMDAKKPEAIDILVQTANPEALERTIVSLGVAARLVQDGLKPGGYARVEGCYVVRCFGDPDFLEFAITNQGYGTVVRRLESLL